MSEPNFKLDSLLTLFLSGITYPPKNFVENLLKDSTSAQLIAPAREAFGYFQKSKHKEFWCEVVYLLEGGVSSKVGTDQ